MSPKQKKIMQVVESEGCITLDRAAKEIPVYTNSKKHAGNVLSRLVKSGHIRRVEGKRGLFEIAPVAPGCQAVATISDGSGDSGKLLKCELEEGHAGLHRACYCGIDRFWGAL